MNLKLGVATTNLLGIIGVSLLASASLGEDFSYYENYTKTEPSIEMSIHDGGDYYHTKNGLTFEGAQNNTTYHIESIDGIPTALRSGWSMRTRVTLEEILDDEYVFFAIGTTDYHHAGLRERLNGETTLQAGRCKHPICVASWSDISLPILNQELFLQFDGYGDELLASVWKPGEPNSLEQHIHVFPMAPTQPAIAMDGQATVKEMWISSSSIPISFTPGDFDNDGALNQLDIDHLTAALESDDSRYDLDNNFAAIEFAV